MDRERMRAAIAEFLAATGVDLTDPHLQGTPQRVADTWADEILSGYRDEPAQVLGDLAPADGSGPVVITGIRYVGVCPHHLLPYLGTAHVAYRPGAKVVGFGQLIRLVEALGARLMIKETLAGKVTGALMELLGAEGAACVLESKQACVALRGVRRHEAEVTVSAFRGAYEASEGNERREFFDAIAQWHAKGRLTGTDGVLP